MEKFILSNEKAVRTFASDNKLTYYDYNTDDSGKTCLLEFHGIDSWVKRGKTSPEIGQTILLCKKVEDQGRNKGKWECHYKKVEK